MSIEENVHIIYCELIVTQLGKCSQQHSLATQPIYIPYESLATQSIYIPYESNSGLKSQSHCLI